MHRSLSCNWYVDGVEGLEAPILIDLLDCGRDGRTYSAVRQEGMVHREDHGSPTFDRRKDGLEELDEWLACQSGDPLLY
jgi:hypothetical protein